MIPIYLRVLAFALVAMPFSAQAADKASGQQCSGLFGPRSTLDVLFKPQSVMAKWRLNLEDKVEHFKVAVDEDNRAIIRMIGDYHDYNSDQLAFELNRTVDHLLPYVFPRLENLSENSLEWWSFPPSHEISNHLARFAFVDARNSRVDYLPQLTSDVLKVMAYYRGFYPLGEDKILRSRSAVPESIHRETAHTLLLSELLYLLRAHGIIGAVGPVATAHSMAFAQLRVALNQEDDLLSLGTASWYSKLESFDEVQKLAAETEQLSTAAVKNLATRGTFEVIRKTAHQPSGQPVVWPMSFIRRVAVAKTTGTSRHQQTPLDAVEHLENLIRAKLQFDRLVIADKKAKLFGNSFDLLARSNKSEQSEARMLLNSLLHPIQIMGAQTAERQEKISVAFFQRVGWLKGESDLLKFLLETDPKYHYTNFEQQAVDLIALRRAVREI